jgi:hypothetical protein
MNRPIPDFVPYPDEVPKMAYAMNRLSAAFDFTHFTDTNKAIFDIAAHEEFARIGIEIAINWQEIIRKGEDGTEAETGVWIPNVEPIGRTNKETETDHDRMRYGIVHGLDGGEPGYIREDGRKTEDPRKKDIL